MKLWHGLLLILGVVILAGGLGAMVLLQQETPPPEEASPPPSPTEDIPLYSSGEASAIVGRTCGWTGDDLTEKYVGQGIWEVRSLSGYQLLLSPNAPAYSSPNPAIFKIDEKTGTVEPFNDVAKVAIEERKIAKPVSEYTGKTLEAIVEKLPKIRGQFNPFE